MSDEELAREAQAGSRAAFTELVDRYESRLYNFVLRRVKCEADAEDITQDAFVRAWSNINRYKSRWRFSTWLFTIASRLAINIIRTRQRTQHTYTTHAAAYDIEDGIDEDRSINKEHGRYLWSIAADVLSNTQHAALWLRYAEDMPVRDISRILNKSSIAVRVQLFRARQRLAECEQYPAERPKAASEIENPMKDEALPEQLPCADA